MDRQAKLGGTNADALDRIKKMKKPKLVQQERVNDDDCEECDFCNESDGLCFSDEELSRECLRIWQGIWIARQATIILAVWIVVMWLDSPALTIIVGIVGCGVIAGYLAATHSDHDESDDDF